MAWRPCSGYCGACALAPRSSPPARRSESRCGASQCCFGRPGTWFQGRPFRTHTHRCSQGASDPALRFRRNRIGSSRAARCAERQSRPCHDGDQPVNAKGSRTVTAASFDVNAPFVNTAVLNVVGRFDRHSDGYERFSPRRGSAQRSTITTSARRTSSPAPPITSLPHQALHRRRQGCELRCVEDFTFYIDVTIFATPGAHKNPNLCVG